MFSGKGKFIFFILLFISSAKLVSGQDTSAEEKLLLRNIEVLRNYFIEDENWHTLNPEVGTNVESLLHFIQDQPIDDIIKNLNDTQRINGYYVTRFTDDVEDSLSVPGYVSYAELQKTVQKIEREYRAGIKPEQIVVPPSIIQNAEKKAPQIPEGEGIRLFSDSVYILPKHLSIPDIIPDTVLNSPVLFSQLVQIDSLRKAYIEEKRLIYNDSIKADYVSTVVTNYRLEKIEENLRYLKKSYIDEVTLNNHIALKNYNDLVVAEVNDSIQTILNILLEYADYIDTTNLTFVNRVGEKEDILLQSGTENYTRVWLKNEQNDSLAIIVKNMDKNSIQMLIDDGVMFSYVKEKQTKALDFEFLKPDFNTFQSIGNSYKLETPWHIGGDGSIGLTQTYLENWKKGGKSSLAMLFVLKGFANYSNNTNKVKWENSGEIRNGWIKQGGEDSELRKNDDKFELTSRFGLSAFKKWYYSAELNFNTQLFRGYNYPKSENPEAISAFLAPAKTYMKIGLDYKPQKNLSLFLSPLSLKNVYVRDTSLVDQTNYGIKESRKAFWEPGVNAELSFKTNITEDITYETKYKMFMNYKDPFKKFDLNWENELKMQLNSHIDLRLMFHFIYDDDVLFKIENELGEKIGEEPRLQVKEFFTIGFSYKIDKKVMKTHRIR